MANNVVFSLGLAEFSFEDLHESKGVHNLVKSEILDVLFMVVGPLGSFELLVWLSWVNTLEDAESSEIFEGESELSCGFGTGYVLGDLSLHSLLQLLSPLELLDGFRGGLSNPDSFRVLVSLIG